MISVVINAKNEEKMIRVCLESVKWADEIIVVLNDSTDNTEKIVKNYTDKRSLTLRIKIFKVTGQDFARVKNKGLVEAEGDWILFLDADERILASLREEILELIIRKEKQAYAISRKNIIFGQEVSYGSYQHDWVIRLVRKDSSKGWVGQVHEHLEFNGKLGYTKNSLLHLTHRDIDQIVLKSLEWSKIDAKLRLESGHPKMSSWRFLRILLTELFNQGVLRKGFFSGEIGMMDAILQTFSLYISYIRLWEMQQPKPPDKIYDDIDQKLIENGFKFP